MDVREQLMRPLVDAGVVPHEAFPVGALIFFIVCLAALMLGWAAGRA